MCPHSFQNDFVYLVVYISSLRLCHLDKLLSALFLKLPTFSNDDIVLLQFYEIVEAPAERLKGGRVLQSKQEV
jgi:hypothetical protein